MSERSLTGRALAVFFVLLAAAVPARAATGAGVPGYTVDEDETLSGGVRHLVLSGGGSVAHVAVVEPGSGMRLRTVLAGDRVGGPLERTSEMCRRADCVVAVNADFTFPGTALPVGGVVRDGALLKSPSPAHHQLLVGRDGSLAAGSMSLSGRLVATDLTEVVLDGVNAPREEGQTVVYTPVFGRRTGTNRFGAELVVRVVKPEGALELGETALVELVAWAPGRGDTRIPAGGAVISAHGESAGALAELWRRARRGEVGERALLRLEAEPDAYQSVGGTPVLLRDGRRWFDPAPTDFVQGLHPRTAVAWDDEGRVFLVTVDGRQPGYSEGASVPDVAGLALALGATDALNLDGGGSTTFVVGGRVVNQPSDRLVERAGRREIVQEALPGDAVVGGVERPVTTALVLVPEGAGSGVSADPLAAGLDLPDVVRLTPPTGVDPASNPSGALPAVVLPIHRRPPDPRAVALAVAALAVAAVSWGLVSVRRAA